MRGMRNIALGVIAGLAVGLWLGVNIGRDQPLFGNPFEERTVKQKLKDAGKEVGEAVERSGRALQERLAEER